MQMNSTLTERNKQLTLNAFDTLHQSARSINLRDYEVEPALIS